VAQVVLSRLAFGHSAATAVRNPRFHVPFFGGTIELDSTAPPALHRDLQARGEAVRARELDTTAVQLIVVDADGRRAAAADPRKFGSGAVR
jgi:gamma-glutamyltranspeptidase